MKTILQFVQSLKLNKADEEVLIRHVEECRVSASGPSLDDKCTDRVRRYLKSKPAPADLSWNGSIALEDALNAGFTSKQAYKMGIPSIGIVAVLVANVTFIAWATPPGGPSPYWLGCDYPLFTAFLIVNGIAFMLAVASAVVVTAFPLVLSRTPHQAALWGGILLMLSMLAFIVAFVLAGFVTVGFKAPAPSCSSIHCTEGGIACSTELVPWMVDAQGNALSTYFAMDPNMAALNSISNTSSGAGCVTYNRSVSHGTYSTLYAWVPDVDFTSSNYSSSPGAAEAITQLFQDEVVQAETVCMDETNLPSAIDPRADPETLAVNVTYDIPDLAAYLNEYEVTVYDLLPNSSFTQLFSYYQLTGSGFFCLSQETEETMKFDVLCDAAVQSSAGNLSVSKTGEYIRAVTAAQSGAVLFDSDITAQQVAKAIKALAGVFAFILLVIIIFLIKSKWF